MESCFFPSVVPSKSVSPGLMVLFLVVHLAFLVSCSQLRCEGTDPGKSSWTEPLGAGAAGGT